MIGQDINDVKEKSQSLLSACIDYTYKNNSTAMSVKLQALASEGKGAELGMYQIAVMGFMKRGKSTLLNVLLGRSDDTLSPVNSCVCTGTITKYLDVSQHPQNSECAVVEFANGRELEVPYSKVKEFSDNSMNRNNEKAVRCIRVYGRFPYAGQSVAFVDTPGEGSVYKEHDAIADSFLGLADAVIVTIAADNFWTQDDKEFVENLPQEIKDKLIFVVTKMDIETITEKDRREFRSTLQQELNKVGITNSRIVLVGAKSVFDLLRDQASQEDIRQAAQKWGIATLEATIEQLVKAHSGKNNFIKGYLNKVVNAVSACLDSEKSDVTNALENLSKKRNEIEQNMKQLIEARNGLVEYSKKQSQMFIRDWNYTVGKFFDRVENDEKYLVISNLRDRVRRINTVDLLTNQQKAFSTEVVGEITSALREPTRALGSSIDKIMRQYADNMSRYIEYYSPNKSSSALALNSKNALSLSNIALAGSGITCIAGTAIIGYGAVQSASLIPVLSTLTGAAGAASATIIIGSMLTGGALFAGLGAVALKVSKTRDNMVGQVAGVVDKQFATFREVMQQRLDAARSEIIFCMQNAVQEQLYKSEQDLNEISRVLESPDRSSRKRNELEARKKQIATLDAKCKELKNSICIC